MFRTGFLGDRLVLPVHRLSVFRRAARVSALWQFTIFSWQDFADCASDSSLEFGAVSSRDAEKGGEGSEPADDRRAVSPIRKMLDRRAEKNAKQKAEASGRKSEQRRNRR